MEGKRCLVKKKTRTARRTLEPLYQQQLEFKVEFTGKTLQVSRVIRFYFRVLNEEIIYAVTYTNLNWFIFILQKESHFSITKKRKKRIGHRARLRENDDLPLWRAPVIKKKPPFFLCTR